MLLLSSAIKALYLLFALKLMALLYLLVTEGFSNELSRIYKYVINHPLSMAMYSHTVYRCQLEWFRKQVNKKPSQ